MIHKKPFTKRQIARIVFAVAILAWATDVLIKQLTPP